VSDHVPSSHRRYRGWMHERIAREAASIGDDTAALVEIIPRSRAHPEQGFRSCIGMLDRIVHHAHRIEPRDDSPRERLAVPDTGNWTGPKEKRG